MSDTNGQITKQDLEEAFTRFSQHILHEVETRLDEKNEKLDDIDRRLRRVDGNTITALELLTRQSRWHEESDNAIHDVIKRQGEIQKTLEDLKGRVAKLESGAA